MPVKNTAMFYVALLLVCLFTACGDDREMMEQPKSASEASLRAVKLRFLNEKNCSSLERINVNQCSLSPSPMPQNLVYRLSCFDKKEVQQQQHYLQQSEGVWYNDEDVQKQAIEAQTRLDEAKARQAALSAGEATMCKE